MRWWFCWPLLLVAVLVSNGCGWNQTPPDLITVADVTPRHVEVGDRLEIVGSGFPEGRLGTLTFRGYLHVAGATPRAVSVTSQASSASQNRLVLPISESLRGELLGASPEASHGTFRGDLLVAFSPRQPGAPPVTGTLRDTFVDFAVAAAPRPASQKNDLQVAGQAVLGFLGMTLVDNARPPLVIDAVLPGGRSEEAGLLPGDQLVDFNGVVVRDASDLTPSAGQRWARVSIRRGRLPEPVLRVVNVEGFRPAPLGRLAIAATLVGFAVALMLLFLAPVGRLLAWVERQAVTRFHEITAQSRAGAGTPRAMLQVIWAEARRHEEREPPRMRVVAYLQFLLVSGVLTLPAFGLTWIAEDLDLPLLLLVAVTLLMIAGLVVGGWRTPRRWSLGRGLVSGSLLLLFQLPVAGIGVATVLLTGSTRANDFVAAQGGWPWEWSVFLHPPLLVVLALAFLVTVPQAGLTSMPEVPEVDTSQPTDSGRGRRGRLWLMHFADSGYVLVVAGLVVVMLLGGWRLPGLSPSDQASSLVAQALGACLLQLKLWILLLSVQGVRWVLPQLNPEQLVGTYWVWIAPLTTLMVAITVAGAWNLDGTLVASLQVGASVVLFALTVAVLVRGVIRVSRALVNHRPQLGLNPWL